MFFHLFSAFFSLPCTWPHPDIVICSDLCISLDIFLLLDPSHEPAKSINSTLSTESTSSLSIISSTLLSLYNSTTILSATPTISISITPPRPNNHNNIQIVKQLTAFDRLVQSCHPGLDCSINELAHRIPSTVLTTTANSLYTCFRPYLVNNNNDEEEDDDAKNTSHLTTSNYNADHNNVFLDIGAGIGNCCFVAAHFFAVKQVIGIEYNKDHHRTFQQILDTLPKKLLDAQDYCITDPNRLTSIPIQHIVGDICDHPDVFQSATHCYSLNPKWPDVTIKWILNQLCLRYPDQCRVTLVIWAVTPEQCSTLCRKFFRSAWCNIETNTAQLNKSGSKHQVFVYERMIHKTTTRR